MRKVIAAAAPLVFAVLAGCGTKTTVNGKVTYNNAPVTGGSVTLVGGDGVVHSGNINPDGSYAIPDVPTGDVKIGVAGPNPTAGVKPPPAGRGAEVPGRDVGRPPPKDATPPPAAGGPTVPPAYLDPQTSGLTGKVAAGQPLNIDLK